MAAHLESWLDEYKPDFLAVMVGINDGYILTPLGGDDKSGLLFSRKMRVVKLVEWLWSGIKGHRWGAREDALKEGKYEDYFFDRFASDFGHCTAKGNKLLAENISRSILKKYK